jgi:hypothetical protein
MDFDPTGLRCSITVPIVAADKLSGRGRLGLSI